MTAKGRVLRRLPRVSVRLLGPDGASFCLAIVDSGFAGSAALPEEVRRRLGLTLVESTEARFADGVPRTLPVAEVRIEIGGEVFTRVEALVTGQGVLIGMDLLAGHRLTLDVVEGGPVTIAPLSQSSPDTP